ncbi:hypothetical protein [Citrobacter werkmanii]|uniref:Uncharacterized protein n=1 Tax=Citrobacter werkmanii TaxID=67827 RepID=A0ABM8N1P4_9ENTR|nr:hypothetical protein [Citrobacter werkmanii]CAC9226020.1 Uncharacterised protein [Citrobacter werkmanii]
MKTFFIQNEDTIKIIISFALMLNGLLIITFYFYNKIAYKKIVDIYEKEIGPLPVTAIICKKCKSIYHTGLYLTKVAFIMETLIFRYNKVSNYGMSIEGYNLIRGLPCKLTLGFKIEAMLWILCIPVLLSMFIAF